MREVARQAGVSAAAPYHHFADKAALIAALATEGYAALTAALRAAWAAEDDPAERIAALGMAYVRFAVAHPAAFRLMFRPELRGLRADASLAQAAAASYGVLVAGIRAAQDAGAITPGDPAPLALTAWATVHGLAVLLVDGPEHDPACADDAVAHTAARVTHTLLHGLVRRP